MMPPKRTRSEQRRINRGFSECFLLPLIVRVVRATVRPGPLIRTSALLSEIDTIGDLRHLLNRKHLVRELVR